MVSEEQGRGPGVGKAPSQRCMSDLTVKEGRVTVGPGDPPGGEAGTMEDREGEGDGGV